MKSFIAGALCISMISMVDGVMSPGYVHHNNSALAEYLMYVNTSYSDITYLYSIGQSVTGQELWVLAIGKHMHDYVPLRPSVKYVGNMHGNEVVGRELLIHLIDFYVTSYGTNATITNFLNTTVVHIMPTMNPDGYDSAVEGECDDNVGRKNANGIDLNRNFPDYLRNRSQYGPIQQETKAVMEWTSKHNFILSANLFGGAAVASYPFDQYVDANTTIGSGPAVAPDDDVFRFLSLIYARSHHTMAATNASCAGYNNNETFFDGITNGADWYPLAGTMQDYSYLAHGILEISLDVSCCIYPNASDLQHLWVENKDALVNYLLEVHRGVKGIITDINNNLVKGAKVTIKGRESASFKSSDKGEYYRLLLPGNYTLQIFATGYQSVNQAFTVRDGTVTRQDVTLIQVPKGAATSVNNWSHLPMLTVLYYIGLFVGVWRYGLK